MELSHLTPTIIETYLKYGLKKSFEREGELKDKTVIFQLKEGDKTFKERITYYVGKKKSSVVVEGKGDREFMTNDLKRLNDLLETDKPKVFIDYAFSKDDDKSKEKHLPPRLMAIKNTIEELGFKVLLMAEEGDSGKFLLQKLEDCLYSADFGIVLMSADVKEARKKYHTRPNVMIELGMMISHFHHEGLSNRWFLINGNEKELEIPTDILGLAYWPYNEDKLFEKLAQELYPLYFMKPSTEEK